MNVGAAARLAARSVVTVTSGSTTFPCYGGDWVLWVSGGVRQEEARGATTRGEGLFLPSLGRKPGGLGRGWVGPQTTWCGRLSPLRASAFLTHYPQGFHSDFLKALTFPAAHEPC